MSVSMLRSLLALCVYTGLLANPSAVQANSLGVGDANACVTSSTGSVECWGGPFRWVGGGLAQTPLLQGPGGAWPVARVGGLEAVRRLSVGGDVACVIEGADRRVLCWGYTLPPRRDDRSRSGSGSSVPIEVPLVRGARDVVVTNDYACVVTRVRTVRCWGATPGVNGPQVTPRRIPGLRDVKQVAGSLFHACALTTAGAIYCWGSNGYGETSPQRGRAKKPTLVQGVPAAWQIAVHSDGSCALTRAGMVICWGAGGYRPTRHPKPVEPLPRARSISMAGRRTCTVGVDRKVRCWGSRASSALGISSGTKHPASSETTIIVKPKFARRAVTVKGLPPVESVALGDSSTCAVNRAQAVWCWGDPRVASAGIARDVPWPKYADGVPIDTPEPQLVTSKFHQAALAEAGPPEVSSTIGDLLLR